MRLNVPASFGRLHVLPYLPEFAANYPDIRLDITFTDTMVDIIDTGTDLAIRTGTLADSRLIARKLAPHRRLLCASPSLLAAQGPIETPADLMRCPAVLFNLQPNDRWILVDAQGQREDVVLSGQFRANDSEALLAAAIAGFGVALLPSWIVSDAIRTGKLVRVLKDSPRDVRAGRAVRVGDLSAETGRGAESARVYRWVCGLYWDAALLGSASRRK